MELVTSDISIEVRTWLESNASDDQERETLAEISIFSSTNVLTRVEDERSHSIRPFVKISAGHLAEWFLSNWWRHAFESDFVEPYLRSVDWRLSHEMPAIGDGYAWPPYSISGDGRECLIHRIAEQSSSGASPIAYLGESSLRVPCQKFQQAVLSFCITVVERLRDRGVFSAPLVELFELINEESRSASARRVRQREAVLGFDPDTIPADLQDFLDSEGRSKGQAAVDEIVGALKASGENESYRTAFLRIQNELVRNEAATIPSILRERNGQAGPLNSVESAAVDGYTAARQVRHLLGLRDTPATNDVLENVFEISSLIFTRPENPSLPVGVGERGSFDKLAFALSSRNISGRRFEFARLIGDHLAYPTEDSWRPATASKAYRQRLQRAFAAEFLLPTAMLKDRFGTRPPTSAAVEDVAQEYAVSPMVVHRQIQNQLF